MSDNKKTAIKILDILVETAQFLILSYLLGSALISFKTNILFILFFATNVALIEKHWKMLNRTIPNKIVSICIFVLSLLVLVLIFIIFGYFSIGTMPKMLL